MHLQDVTLGSVTALEEFTKNLSRSLTLPLSVFFNYLFF